MRSGPNLPPTIVTTKPNNQDDKQLEMKDSLHDIILIYQIAIQKKLNERPFSNPQPAERKEALRMNRDSPPLSQ
jgi:hypothetical protein